MRLKQRKKMGKRRRKRMSNLACEVSSLCFLHCGSDVIPFIFGTDAPGE
jgi:hypothetical protein